MANTISTQINPAIYAELAPVLLQTVTVDGAGAVNGTGPVVRVAPRPYPAGTVIAVRDYFTLADLPATSLDASGYLAGTYNMGTSLAVIMSADAWATTLGPFISIEGQLAAAQFQGALGALVAKSALPLKGDLLVGTGTSDASGTQILARVTGGTTPTDSVLAWDPALPNGVGWKTGIAKSTYQIWLDAGNTGTQADFLLAERGPAGPAGLAGVSPPPFGKAGPLVVGVGGVRWYNDTGQTLNVVAVRATVGVVPTGAPIIVDVNRNDVTVFGTQANRPTIPVSSKTSARVLPAAMSVTTVAAGQYLSADVDQVGSTVAGSDLFVAVTLSP